MVEQVVTEFLAGAVIWLLLPAGLLFARLMKIICGRTSEDAFPPFFIFILIGIFISLYFYGQLLDLLNINVFSDRIITTPRNYGQQDFKWSFWVGIFIGGPLLLNIIYSIYKTMKKNKGGQ